MVPSCPVLPFERVKRGMKSTHGNDGIQITIKGFSKVEIILLASCVAPVYFKPTIRARPFVSMLDYMAGAEPVEGAMS